MKQYRGMHCIREHAVVHFVEALRNKLDGRGFDYQWVH